MGILEATSLEDEPVVGIDGNLNPPERKKLLDLIEERATKWANPYKMSANNGSTMERLMSEMGYPGEDVTRWMFPRTEWHFTPRELRDFAEELIDWDENDEKLREEARDLLSSIGTTLNIEVI